MVANLNSGAFTSITQLDLSKKVIAETYMQIYQYAAEDFPSHPDMQRFITDLTNWMISVDNRLAQQMKIIATHVHKIPPHSHAVSNHSLALPIPLTTIAPSTGNAIKWSAIKYPIFINTTLTEPNLTGNRIIVNTASEGSILPTIRRLKPIALTLVPKLSPVLQDALKPI